MDEITLTTILEEGGAAAVLAATAHLPARERGALLRFGVRKIAFNAFPPSFLDDMIVLGDAAIACATGLGDEAEVNVLAFNLSANLCDCWGDAYGRERRHFERGLAYADQALALRLRLGVPLEKVALAHWARGKHLLSLGRFDDAVEAFEEQLRCLSSAPPTPSPPAAALAAEAYLAIARRVAQRDADGRDLGASMAQLRALLDDPAKADDAKVYLDQLVATCAALGVTE